MQRFKSLLESIYGRTDGARLCAEIQSSLLPSTTTAQAPTVASWHRNAILYVTYADSFRTKTNKGSFATLAQEIPRIAQLGCTAIHVLPFLSSPLIDAGFDVSDYKAVRRDLADDGDIALFLNQCSSHGVRPFMDIILNHVSDQHAWFLSATAGDSSKQNYFISRDTPPPFSHTYENSAGVWAVYEEPDKQYHVRIIFPEQAGEFPHWRRGTDDRWYYHTFYPQQLDVNFCNPRVFYDFAEVLVFWARKGFSFRLDAIEFIGKDWYYDSTQEQSKNFLIVEALRELLAHVDGSNVFLAEASQVIEEVRPYFQGAVRNRRVDLAYNFQLSKALFCALLGDSVDGIWERLAESNIEKNGANWITFLRTHDELSFEFAKPEEIKLLQTALVDRGLPFRENYGRSGRLFSLLGKSDAKHIGALLLMASLPGVILLYYGDEYATEDNHDFMTERTLFKKALPTHSNSVANDTRDINRAPISIFAAQSKAANKVQSEVQRILHCRRRFLDMATTYPERIESASFSNRLFIARYSLPSVTLITLINLDKTAITITYSSLKLPETFTQELTIGQMHFATNSITLESFAGAWLTYRTSNA